MAFFESLERRELLAAPPSVIGVIADNRGEVTISFNRSLKDTTVTRSNVQVYTGGPDGIIGNADDVKMVAPVSWNAEGRKMLIRTRGLTAGDGYRIKLNGKNLIAPDGTRLDGEFSGSFPSGNGTPGGNFEFLTRNDRSIAPQVRMVTHHGILTIKMFKDAAPISVANFFNYANSGRYDNIFFTRAIPGFIVQGGSLQLDANDDPIETELDDPIQNEFAVSNTRGTIAFAKQAGDPDSATNQFFFNLADNAGLNTQNGGFTVFGKIVGSAGLESIDAIPTEHDIVALKNPLNGQGVFPTFSATGLTNVPIEDATETIGSTQAIGANPTVNGFVVTGDFDAREQLVMIRRTAVLVNVAPLA